MISRRKFIQNTTALALGSWALTSNESWGMSVPSRPVGVQLFTFFNEIDNDLTGILKKLSELGYETIESAFSMKGGYYGLKPKEFAQTCKNLGLAWRSHHVLGTPFIPPPDVKIPANFPKMRTLKDNNTELADEAAEGGVKYLVCASIDIKTGDAVKRSIEVLNKAGEACRKAGLILAYHNHDKEFVQVDGIVPYDLFLSQLSKDIKMELDLSWCSKAGVDPIALFQKNPGRFPLWHVKDFDKEFKTIMPVGSGIIDFKKIFANAKLAGLEFPFVEHDMPANGMESVASSINYLKTILK